MNRMQAASAPEGGVACHGSVKGDASGLASADPTPQTELFSRMNSSCVNDVQAKIPSKLCMPNAACHQQEATPVKEADTVTGCIDAPMASEDLAGRNGGPG